MNRRLFVMFIVIATLVMGSAPPSAHAADTGSSATANLYAGSSRSAGTLRSSGAVWPSASGDSSSGGSSSVNVYTTPGTHHVNGRDWRTSCVPYSRTQRCTTDIWATQVTQGKGRFVSRTGWVFNNMTYLPSSRSLWKNNNLGKNANWTTSGRRWRTECDTAVTGRNGCRSYIWGQVVASIKTSGGYRYSVKNAWIFNNMVQFSPPSAGQEQPGTAPGACTRETLSGTKFGVTLDIPGGLTMEQAWARANRLYGKPEMLRIFQPGAPSGWKAATVATGMDLSVSFKIQPKDILSGANDAKLRTWFRSAPKDVTIYWTYFHEPENDIQRGAFTPAQYRAAWHRVHKIANETCQPNMHSTLILMDWTLDPRSGRNFDDYYPGSAYIDVLSWDPYNPWGGTIYKDPKAIFEKVALKSKAEGKPFAIAETGSLLMDNDTGVRRAEWITSMAKHLRENGALYVSYFDTNQSGREFRLSDKPSQDAWKAVTQG